MSYYVILASDGGRWRVKVDGCFDCQSDQNFKILNTCTNNKIKSVYTVY